jgi:hypothetical protein
MRGVLSFGTNLNGFVSVEWIRHFKAEPAVGADSVVAALAGTVFVISGNFDCPI